jgi:CHAT domain-containing protein/tetratricopeptide (TPR) repeat protein
MDSRDEHNSGKSPKSADGRSASDQPWAHSERSGPSGSQLEPSPSAGEDFSSHLGDTLVDAEVHTLEHARMEARAILANDALAAHLRPAGREALLGLLMEAPNAAQIERGMHALSVMRDPLAAVAIGESRVAGLPEALRIWYRTSTWQASRLWLAERLDDLPQDAPMLLEEAAKRASVAGDTQGARILQQHAELLREVRSVGVDTAYLAIIGEDAFHADAKNDPPPIDTMLSDRVVEWVRAPDWDASRAYLTAHAGDLLSDDAERLLSVLHDGQPTEGARRAVADHQQLLRDARANGIESAYDAFLRSRADGITGDAELDQLLAEAARLADQGEAVERQEVLYRRILEIDAQIHAFDALSRAGLWGTRGNLLLELAARAGGDGRNALLGDALHCYERALTGYRRDVAPLDWAATLNNKGNTLRAIAEGLGGEARTALLQQALESYNQALLEYRRDVAPRQWALTLSNKGNILRDVADGLGGDERARTLQESLACFAEALLEYRRDVAPLNWAMTLTNKGNALQALAEGLRGDGRAQALEQVVQCFDDALLEFRREVTPTNWAITMNNKGSVLGVLATSQAGAARIETLRRAIACYDDALLERKRKDYPLDWAMTQCNKGNTLGDLADSLSGAARRDVWRQAIDCYDQALLEYHREITPFYWATAQNNKGSTLRDLATNLSGAARAQALQDAISCFDAALLEFQRETTPSDWASTLNNMGSALRDLAESQSGAARRETLQQAIACYDQALLEYGRDVAPLYWAATLNNKGNALGDLADLVNRPAQSEVRQLAITCFDDALLEFRREVTPFDWAMILCNKANALQAMANYLTGAARIETLESAIASCDDALLEFRREVAPFDWAATLNNKGQALQALAHTLDGAARRAIFGRAVGAFTDALMVFTPDVHPFDHRRVARSLARVYLQQSSLASETSEEQTMLQSAWRTAAAAIISAEHLEIQAPSLAFRQREWAENASLYNLAACIRAQQGRLGEALALIERGRARGLDEAAGRRSADVAILSETDRSDYLAALQAVHDVEAVGRQQRDPLIVVQEARAANARLAKVVSRLRTAYPSFLPERQVSAALLKSALRPHEALVYIIPEETGSLVLTLSHRGGLEMKWLHALTAQDVFQMAIYRDAQDERQLGFLPAALGWLGRDARQLVKALDALLPQLGERLMREVVRQVRACGCDRAVLVPSAYLGVLPLHAASYAPLADEPATAPDGRRYACDDVTLAYAPSGLIYRDARQTAMRQARSARAQRVFVAGNPHLTGQTETWTKENKGFLRFAEWEAHRVAELARQCSPPLTVDLALNEQVTRERVLDGLNAADLAHLALHASFNFQDPPNSAFFVAHHEKLLLRDLLDARSVRLAQLRLVALSACQSAMGDFNRQREEAVGLFGALLAGGVCGVVGTLWPVRDRAAAALMEVFAGHYFCDGQSAESALRAATLAIRSAATGTTAAHESSPPEERASALSRTAEVWQSRLDWWAASESDETDVERLLSADELVEIGRDVQTFRAIPRDHPVYWAAFVFHGASAPLGGANTAMDATVDAAIKRT